MATRDDIDRLIEKRRKRNQDILDKYKEQQEKDARFDAINWHDDIAQGVALGSYFGPYGALAGAVYGVSTGMAKAYKQRRKEGTGRWDSIKNTVGDFAPLTDSRTHASFAKSAPPLAAMLMSEMHNKDSIDEEARAKEAAGRGLSFETSVPGAPQSTPGETSKPDTSMFMDTEGGTTSIAPSDTQKSVKEAEDEYQMYMNLINSGV